MRCRARVWVRRFSAIALLISSMQPVYAQNQNELISAGFYDSIDSEILSATRSLQIFLPESYESSNQSYPVLFHLYGDRITQYWLDAVSAVSNLSAAGLMPEVILVGVDEVERYRYLLPRTEAGEATEIDTFLHFFERELVPYIDDRYRTKDYRVLAGPQVGANFGIYALLNSTDLIDAFILNNPFRWVGGRDYLQSRSRELFSQRTELKKFLFITSDADGELDREGLPYLEEFVETAEAARVEGLVIERNHLGQTGEFYSQTGLREGLKSLFAGFDMPDDVASESLVDIQDYYDGYFDRLGFRVRLPELELVLRGDEIRRTDEEKAIELFNYLKQEYPRGGMSYCRLGMIYHSQDRLRPALEHLEDCLRLIPAYPGLVELIAGIRARQGGGAVQRRPYLGQEPPGDTAEVLAPGPPGQHDRVA